MSTSFPAAERVEWPRTGDATVAMLPGNALVTPLVFQVSLGGGDCLPSGNASARLTTCFIKKRKKQRCGSVSLTHNAMEVP
uniref:SFRICE_020145 n=1 Tax=Spodoptera frugiperda TaxID=7108 RepID=A0A2H1VKJ4_SPOFR